MFIFLYLNYTNMLIDKIIIHVKILNMMID